MIKGHEIFKCIDPHAHYLAKDENGKIYWFVHKPYYKESDKEWFRSTIFGCLGKIEIEEFQNKPSGECILEKEQDHREWIGCLCWFYDEENGFTQISVLDEVNIECSYPYLSCGNCQYKHCRPVKPSEIKFFEEK